MASLTIAGSTEHTVRDSRQVERAPDPLAGPEQVGETDRVEFGAQPTVHDPCSGSGRMLLAAASINRHWEFVGQDVDIRCVRMTALNLAFRNLYGYVIWGNTLALDKKLVYRTGFDGCGFVREIPLGNCPTPVQGAVNTPSVPGLSVASTDPLPSSSGKGRQLELF